MGTVGSFAPGVKQRWCEADNSPPSSTDVKNGGAIPPLLYMSSRHKKNLAFLTYISTFTFQRENVAILI
jgi:hypothetical protein